MTSFPCTCGASFDTWELFRAHVEARHHSSQWFDFIPASMKPTPDMRKVAAPPEDPCVCDLCGKFVEELLIRYGIARCKDCDPELHYAKMHGEWPTAEQLVREREEMKRNGRDV